MSPVMNRVHEQIRVETPVEHAFELTCRVDRQREWNPYLTYFHVEAPLDKVSGSFDVVQDLLGQSTAYRGTVVEVTPGRLLRLHLTAEHGTADWVFGFEPAGAAADVTIDVEYEHVGPFAGIVDRFIYHDGLERAVRRMLQNLAATAIAKTPTPA
jgi:hypothetical protein